MAKIINGEKRGRPGRWLVDFYDGSGRRRILTARTRDEAKIIQERVLGESRQQTRPACDPNITLGAYAARWLEIRAVTVKPRSLENYSNTWRLHLAPRFGSQRVRSVQRDAIRGHLVELLKGGMSRGSVRLIHSVLRAVLNAAIGDGLILSNPADKIGRELKLAANKFARQDAVKQKAMDREQVRRLLAAAEPRPRDWALLICIARTGLRSGEIIGLEWPDVNIEARRITVERQISRGLLGTPKGGHGRVVDMTEQLAAALLPLRQESGPVFCAPRGKPMTADRIRGAFARARRAAGLPIHLTPHCLRHSYASQLLQMGEPDTYVQRQLGHSGIQMTVDTYGSWLPTDNRDAVNRLDDELVGIKMVSAGRDNGRRATEVAERIDAELEACPTS